MKLFNKIASCGLIAAAAMSLSSCVNEWPHPEYKNFTLYVHLVGMEWLPSYEMDYTRADDIEIEYLFRIYPHGNTTQLVKEIKMYSHDLERSDFSFALQLPPGTYDIYAWSDVADVLTGESLYYNTGDFARISYTTPYVGDTNNKDAFRGMKTITIEDNIDLDADASATIDMERPLARYMFVATDLEEFVDGEITRGKLRSLPSRSDEESYRSELYQALDGYTVRIYYPLYMPSVFDNFLNRPVDSWTGISFEGGIRPISENDATLGLDYVMMNGSESYIQVAMEVYDEDGLKIAGTPTINIPTLRDRTTIVYGKFLTINQSAGVTINPDFEGQFNIEYK